MHREEGGCRQMEADIMYQFESVIIRVKQCLLKRAKEVNNA
jgi:hypothetical protein